MARLNCEIEERGLAIPLCPAVTEAIREQALRRARDAVSYLARALDASEHINRNGEPDVALAEGLARDLALIVGLSPHFNKGAGDAAS